MGESFDPNDDGKRPAICGSYIPARYPKWKTGTEPGMKSAISNYRNNSRRSSEPMTLWRWSCVDECWIKVLECY